MNLVHIGRVHSHLITRMSAPRRAHEGAPHASLEIRPAYNSLKSFAAAAINTARCDKT